MNTKVREISNHDDMIDVRDVIARVEEINTIESQEAAFDEYKMLSTLLDELRGNGGDEQWRGDWYPVTLIRDSHFTDYAEQLIEDIGDHGDLPGYIVIDWEATARNIRVDYSSVEFDGVTYWYR